MGEGPAGIARAVEKSRLVIARILRWRNYIGAATGSRFSPRCRLIRRRSRCLRYSSCPGPRFFRSAALLREMRLLLVGGPRVIVLRFFKRPPEVRATDTGKWLIASINRACVHESVGRVEPDFSAVRQVLLDEPFPPSSAWLRDPCVGRGFSGPLLAARAAFHFSQTRSGLVFPAAAFALRVALLLFRPFDFPNSNVPPLGTSALYQFFPRSFRRVSTRQLPFQAA